MEKTIQAIPGPIAVLLTIAALLGGCVRLGFSHGEGDAAAPHDGPAIVDRTPSAPASDGAAEDSTASDGAAADASASDASVSDGPNSMADLAVPRDQGAPNSDGGDALASCLTGPGPLVLWRFSESVLAPLVAVQSVPDLAPRAPDLPLLGEHVLLDGQEAVLSHGYLYPASAAAKDALVTALRAADAITLTVWGSSLVGSQYGYLFALGDQLSLQHYLDRAILNISTGAMEQKGLANACLGTAGQTCFLAGGWDGASRVLFALDAQGTYLAPADDYGSFDMASWVPSNMELVLGRVTRAATGSWQGKLREVAIYDRALSEAELTCLRNGPHQGTAPSL